MIMNGSIGVHWGCVKKKALNPIVELRFFPGNTFESQDMGAQPEVGIQNRSQHAFGSWFRSPRQLLRCPHVPLQCGGLARPESELGRSGLHAPCGSSSPGGQAAHTVRRPKRDRPTSSRQRLGHPPTADTDAAVSIPPTAPTKSDLDHELPPPPVR